MKSCVVVAGCLLSFACGESWAAGINLAWTECLGSGGASDRTVACTNGATAENVLFLSFVVPAGIPRLGTVDASIDVQTASALGSWWLGGASRFEGGTSPGSTTCPAWWSAAPRGGIALAPSFAQIAPQLLRIRVVVSVAAGEEQNIPMNGAEWLATTLRIRFDPGPFENPQCAAGACFSCPRLVLHQAGDRPDTVLQTPDVRNFATWQGGRGVVCPSAAPSIPVTWGSIKNLYR